MMSLPRSRAVVKAPVTRNECTVTLGSSPSSFDIAADQLFDCPGRHRLVAKAVPALPASGTGGWKQRPCRIILEASQSQPFAEPLDRFQMQRRGAFLAALAGDVQNAVLAASLVIADSKPHQLADAAAGIGEHGEHGPVAEIDRSGSIRIARGCVEQPAAIVRRQSDRLAVTRHGGGGDKLAVGRVGSAEAVGLQVGEERPQSSQFTANRCCSALAACGKLVPPSGDMLRPNLGQVLERTGSNPGKAKELIQVMLVGFARMRRWGAAAAKRRLRVQWPGGDRRAPGR